MLEKLKGKLVTVFMFTGDTQTANLTVKNWHSATAKGVLTEITDEAIMLDDKIYVARKFIIKIQS